MQLWLVISSCKGHFKIYSCPLSTLLHGLQEGASKTLLSDLRLAGEFNSTSILSFEFLWQELHISYVSGK